TTVPVMMSVVVPTWAAARDAASESVSTRSSGNGRVRMRITPDIPAPPPPPLPPSGANAPPAAERSRSPLRRAPRRNAGPRDGVGNRPNPGGELRRRPLDAGRAPPQLPELDRQRAARHGRVPDVVLIECGYGPGGDAQWTGRVMTLPQQLQQRGAGSLLQHQGAQVFAVGDGPHHGVAGLAPLDALPEGLQQLERVFTVVVAIHLHEAPQRLGP